MIAYEVFIDSNIIIYAHDLDERKKHTIAEKKLQELWQQDIPPNISIQVLQECYVNLIKKNVPLKEVEETIIDYLKWNVINNDQVILKEGMHLKRKYNLSLWDALIIAAAKAAQARFILSEDLNDEQVYEGIRIINPFKNHSSYLD